MRKVTRKNIDKNNMVALSYCQCQTVLDMFGYNYKIGYNSGVYGWNYDLYNINGTNIVTGYNVPYCEYSNKDMKEKLIALENKLRGLSFYEAHEKKEEFKKEFLEIFE